MRKQVGIITINDYKNYGNRLQNYATQEVLKKFNIDVTTIVNENNQPQSPKSTSIILILQEKGFRGFMKIIINKVITRKIRKKTHDLNIIKERSFKKFTKEFINESSFILNPENALTVPIEKFDYFLVGSDQIWNPYFRKGNANDFLQFAPKNKRIAFAPSFGVSEIPKEYEDDYRLWLSQMKHLSVREGAGVKIIRNLTGRDAELLLDPTLMLDKEEWISVSNKPESLKKPYILTYFLGGISPNRKKFIDELARREKCIVINLGNIKEENYYTIDPSEFLGYIYHSKVLLTDSFHGCVFSILFERPFVVFERDEDVPSMNSRISTLLATFELESRMWGNIKKNQEEIFKIDFAHIQPILKIEREKSYEYLKTALEI